MSQITRTGGGSGPTPGDAVLTLSGDGGLPVSPNLEGNIDLDGAGGITVTSNTLTNSLTITGSGGAALTFDGDTGIGTTPAANTITFNGAANQITVASPGTGAGHLTVAMTPSIVVANNITATSGGLSIHGNGTFGGGLLVTAVSSFYDALSVGFVGGTGLHVLHGDIILSTPGSLYLGGLTNGALVVNGASQVTAAQGAAGTVLTSNGLAAAPTFQALPAPPAAVTVAGALNQITVAGGPAYTLSIPNTFIAPGSIEAHLGDIALTNGRLSVGGSTGLAGQVLTSQGTANPIWTNALTFAWHTVAVATPLVASNGYITNSAGVLIFTLPALAAIGDEYDIVGISTGGWRVVYGATQYIIFGDQTTTVATGNVASTNRYDQITIMCVATNTAFVVRSAVGNITIA
jgi:hypothetical protein